MGIHCSGKFIPSGVSMVCANGLEMVRPFVAQLTDLRPCRPIFRTVTSRSLIQNSIMAPCNVLRKETTFQGFGFRFGCTSFIRVEPPTRSWSVAGTFRPHFPAAGGNYEHFSQMEEKDYQCAPLEEQDEDSTYILFEFVDQLLEPIIKLCLKFEFGTSSEIDTIITMVYLHGTLLRNWTVCITVCNHAFGNQFCTVWPRDI